MGTLVEFNSNSIAIDIETVENDEAKNYYAAKKYEPDSRLKDPAKIEQNIIDKRHKDMMKAGLYWWTGKVICICAEPLNGHKAFTAYGHDELTILESFFEYLMKQNNPNLVGKSSADFDIPFLIGRCLRHDIGVPYFLRQTRKINDIDQIFGFSSHNSQRSNLNDYAHGLCIKPKTSHGSKVQETYNLITMGDQEKWKEITSYCAHDTTIVAEMLKRYEKPWTSKLATIEQPKEEPFETPIF